MPFQIGCAPPTFHSHARTDAPRENQPPTPPEAPPLTIRLDAALADEQRDQLRRVLCTMHGFPAGLPLDAQAPPELVEAHYRVSRAHVVVDVVLQVQRDGTLRIMGGRTDATCPDVDATVRGELRISEAYRVSKAGDALPAYAGPVTALLPGEAEADAARIATPAEIDALMRRK